MAHVCLSAHSLAQLDRDRVVVTCDDRSTTAAGLHQHVALLSNALSKLLNVVQGDRAALIGLNTDVFFYSLLAVLDAGAVGCPLNWRWSPAELAAAIDVLQPKVLFVDDHCVPLAAAACILAVSSSSGVETVIWLTRTPGAAQPAMFGSINNVITVGDLLHQTHAGISQEPAASPLSAGQSGPGVAGKHCYQDPSASQLCQPDDGQFNHTGTQLQLLQPGPQQPALIVFTSGTTGASKGVMLSHQSLVHQSLAKLAVVQYASRDTYLHMAPLFHIGGLSSAFAVLMAGGSHVFMPRYTPTTALQLIRQHKVTSLIAVPAMMQDLTQAAAAAAAQPGSQTLSAVASAAAAAAPQLSRATNGTAALRQQEEQLPSLQRILVGAGGMPPRLQRAVAALFPHAELQTAYGMTEASSSITFISVPQQQSLAAAAAAAAGKRHTGTPQPLDPPAQAPSHGVCVGKAAPGVAVRIDASALTDTSSSSSSRPHHLQRQGQQQQQQQQQQCAPVPIVGEVCTRGPHVMLGYWRDAASTQAVLSHNGWLHTGDLGYLDSGGNLWLVGRCKDMIKTGGENVHAAEVEAVLLSHPAVAAAAVFGLQHERLGEQVTAAVVLQPHWAWAGPGQLPVPPAAAGTSSTTQHPRQHVKQQGRPHGVVSAADLQQHCRAALLSAYRLPRMLVCVSELPLNSSGKVVKAVLKEQVHQQLAAQAATGTCRMVQEGVKQQQREGPCSDKQVLLRSKL